MHRLVPPRRPRVLEGERANTEWIGRDMPSEFDAERVTDRVAVEGKALAAAGVPAVIDMPPRFAGYGGRRRTRRAL